MSPVLYVAGLGPLALLAIGLVPSSVADRNAASAVRGGTLAAASSFFSALGASVLAVVLAGGAASSGTAAECGPVAIDLYFDALTAVMLTLVSFLGLVVMRFSGPYLDGDPHQGRFVKWLALTLASVLSLILSGNLLVFTAAWISTSLCLHQLLVFHGKPAALLAARKKFLVSRAGDACLIAGLFLVWKCFGTWNFESLFHAAEALRLHPASHAAECFSSLGLLLAAGAALKSAQFPFHSWLPDTMETPTPVSALMHAGIINAGGFLVMRLAPVITLSSPAMHFLLAIGTVTALFGSLVMLTQTSVKKSLAFSTVAQMGFMMLECGMGAFEVAALHLVAHSIYKAHAFLSSGSAVGKSSDRYLPVQAAPVPFYWLAAVQALAPGALALGWSFWMGSGPAALALDAILGLAVAHMIWTALLVEPLGALVWRVLGAAILLAAASLVLQTAAHAVLGSVFASARAMEGDLSAASAIAVPLLFATLLLFQWNLVATRFTPQFHALYVHAHNGFYMNTLANRAVQTLWPARSAAAGITSNPAA